MDSKLILLNGPPRSGKDALAGEVARQLRELLNDSKYPQLIHEKLSYPLKRGVAAIFDKSLDELERSKDMINPDLFERSYRRAQIDLFHWLERTHGPDVLGQLFAARTRNSKNEIIIVSDCGRADEVHSACLGFAPSNCQLFRIHRDGTDYSGDIRSYVKNTEAYGLDSKDVSNNGDLAHAGAMIVGTLISKWQDLPWKCK